MNIISALFTFFLSYAMAHLAYSSFKKKEVVAEPDIMNPFENIKIRTAFYVFVSIMYALCGLSQLNLITLPLFK